MLRHHGTLAASYVLAAGLVFLAGCSRRSSTGPDGPGYPGQTTPDSVIEKLEMAYENMDTDAYMECLAEDFVFFLDPEEVAADSTLPEYWGRAEELRVHEHMFADTTTIESVALSLTVTSKDSLPGEDPADPSDDLWEYETHFDLRVESGLPYFATGEVVFVMRRAPDREGTTWQVIEQHDLIVPPEWVQYMTLTRIKLGFGGVVHDDLYPIRSTPGHVILKLVLAYQRMDAEAYLDCLAEDFLFHLNPDDLTQHPELPESWGKAEETAIHSSMFGEGTEVEGVSLEMVMISTEYDPGADPEVIFDDRWTYREDVDLRVEFPPDLTLGVWGYYHDFVLAVDPDETSETGDPLWKIVEWYDINPWGSRTARISGTTWGAIKAIFLSWR
jgi:ketosteroid isomerase-like protein